MGQIVTDEEPRLDMHDEELNRVLGGGLVPGSSAGSSSSRWLAGKAPPSGWGLKQANIWYSRPSAPS